VRDITVAIGTLELDGGERLPAVEQRVTTYGDRKNPVVLVAHPLTGSSRVAEWWPAIAGPGGFFDARECCIVGINALGSCYGSTGPASRSGIFPRITVRDIVRAQSRALDELGFTRLEFVVGGSLGGMQALQWALASPERVANAVVIGAHDHNSAMGIALNAIQRECLDLDPLRGLRTARKLATLTYKSEALLRERHGRRPDRGGGTFFDVEGYLDRQAGRFETRMDAATYATLTHAMDSFDVRDIARGAPAGAPRINFIGISSDWLFRPEDVRSAAANFEALGYPVTYSELQSDHGHDAFLAEPTALRELMRRSLVETDTSRKRFVHPRTLRSRA
jgi:homoserine O-acetyltransferase/O-succinyltransferase